MFGNLGFGDPIGPSLDVAAWLAAAYLGFAVIATTASVAGWWRSRRRPV